MARAPSDTSGDISGANTDGGPNRPETTRESDESIAQTDSRTQGAGGEGTLPHGEARDFSASDTNPHADQGVGHDYGGDGTQ